MIDKQNKPLIANSAQELQNDSFDREFGVAVAEGLVYNQVTGTLDRMVQPGQELPTSGLNASITLSQSDNVVASTQTLTKIINGESYERTLSYNGAGEFLSASAWSKI